MRQDPFIDIVMLLVQWASLLSQREPLVSIDFDIRQQVRKEQYQQPHRHTEPIPDQQKRFGVDRQHHCGAVRKRAEVHSLKDFGIDTF